ncbi:acetyl-CoA hydrolase/transferase family protein [Lysinibacillus endophyticus]|uniref:Acetyl-CoA hydrolase/transferase family protein n=1 Tax=Ureibacillus endophyticus TaxID=1978490 RepID=A0A494ZAE8_9BACL|nr:acetyl-CoA hydrolase/transferase family protein [Lysinibacillus endophyticus]MCP1146288.1 acetyl-CoA hydrolase/transferase family protein [Lysinibacillus endophyticus]RKQ19590.1 acetyl-CoA hydrolase/transferase family protein [Lysinibacillus endophyticus]
MDPRVEKRLGLKQLAEKVVSAQEAAALIEDGSVVGMSGFTRAGDAKVVPMALVERAKNEKFKIDVYTGASLGPEVDKYLAEAGVIRKRGPFQADAGIRNLINAGEITYVDAHLSHNAELVRQGIIGPIKHAIIEAVAITEEGYIIPTTSVGNSPIFVEYAENVIIELNITHPESMIGIHDIYVPGEQGKREPIPMTDPEQRIGTIGIKVDPAKIQAIVVSEEPDAPSMIVPPDEETQRMANLLLDFFRDEIKAGRLTNELMPLQSGVGSVANAVLDGFADSEFENLVVASEVLQDAVFNLIDAGKVRFAAAASITLTKELQEKVYGNLERYADKICLRPQEISNHPELIRRLGLISINTALELDIYGNVNSTHVSGTRMMNGIGGSGDFARNARLGIFVTKSYAKGGAISSIVPMVSHVDHTEHDVDIIVTEQGLADLRGLAPKERAKVIIENCAHPDYKEQLWDYFNRAVEATGNHQTPHILEEALSWHVNLAKNKTMKKETANV